MDEQPFELPVAGGALRGHHGGEGAPALLLHGGAAVPDYTGECAELLDSLFSTIRYTQRGTPPSGGVPTYTADAHVADAIAVLDAFELPRAWAIGHARARDRRRGVAERHRSSSPCTNSAGKRAAGSPRASVPRSIPDCGHFPWVEQPEVFRAAVERFVH